MELAWTAGIAFALLAFAGAAYGWAVRGQNRPDRILGLLYHRLMSREDYDRVEPRTEKLFGMPADRFREHLSFLRTGGYNPVSADQVMEYLELGEPLPSKPVLITFDDGCESVYRIALPILREFGYPALLFVTTNPESWVFHYGNLPQRRVNEEEMRELERANVTIGSHAVSHDALEAMSAAEIEKELGDSKNYLEAVLGKPVRYFGVPLNWYGKKVRLAAELLGYQAVFTSDNGTMHGDSDVYNLPRFIIEGSFSSDEFAENLKASSVVQRRIISTMKRLPSRALGPKLWMPLREVLFASPLGRFFHLRAFKRLLEVGIIGLFLLAILLVYLVIRR